MQLNRQDWVMGWDIGGAHLKACLIDGQGTVQQGWQLPCPVWQGLHVLQQALQSVLQQLPIELLGKLQHAVTMTAELVDLFDDRQQGVLQISQLLHEHIANCQFYTAHGHFVAYKQVAQYSQQIASANWLASGQWLAQHYAAAVLIDIGSTTSDFIVLADGKVRNTGLDDASRLSNDELLYSGVVRTPLMALASRIDWADNSSNVAAEYFATTADVYRLTGELSAQDDVADTADGKDKSVLASQRRIARMVGADLTSLASAQCLALAQAFKAAQMQLLQQNLQRLVHRLAIAPSVPLLGMGAGHFLVAQLAELAQREYVPVSSLIPAQQPELQYRAMVCLPAYAVAALLAMPNAGLGE
jgi:probable H4MPT-linked C1 transfer pathway protein